MVLLNLNLIKSERWVSVRKLSRFDRISWSLLVDFSRSCMFNGLIRVSTGVLTGASTFGSVSVASNFGWTRVPRTRMSAVCLCLQTCPQFKFFSVSVSASVSAWEKKSGCLCLRMCLPSESNECLCLCQCLLQKKKWMSVSASVSALFSVFIFLIVFNFGEIIHREHNRPNRGLVCAPKTNKISRISNRVLRLS